MHFVRFSDESGIQVSGFRMVTVSANLGPVLRFIDQQTKYQFDDLTFLWVIDKTDSKAWCCKTIMFGRVKAY